MSFLKPGKAFEILVLFAFFAVGFWMINRAKQGKAWELRRLPAMDAIEEAVGRSTEMGRPVLFIIGNAALTAVEGPQTLASAALLGYVARIAARLSAPLLATTASAEMAAVLDRIVRDGYAAEGKLEEYKSDYTIRIFPGGAGAQYGYYWGVMGMMAAEKVGANIVMGNIALETLPVAEQGAALGAIQIFGTARLTNMQYLISSCDYVVIGAELYAAAAYTSGEPQQLATINGEDLWKIVSAGIIGLGLVLFLAGVDLAAVLSGF